MTLENVMKLKNFVVVGNTINEEITKMPYCASFFILRCKSNNYKNALLMPYCPMFFVNFLQ